MSAIAIDGPAGAGKSTIGVVLAKVLGCQFLDSDLLIQKQEKRRLSEIIEEEGYKGFKDVDNIDISIEYKDGVQQVILNGENVTSLLRTEETGKMASKTSKYAAVRTKLVALQRGLAKKTDVIMDGRDIGTTVLPDAFAKIYLTASSDARAKRRYDELKEKGENCSFDAIKEDIEKRDYEDMHRAISPLKQADDAVLVDTSDMNIEQVVAALSKIIDEKKAGR